MRPAVRVDGSPLPVWPHAREDDIVAAGDYEPGGYEPGELVWVWRGAAWRPGEVLAASDCTVTVRFSFAGRRRTAVDTVVAEYVRRREVGGVEDEQRDGDERG